MRLGILAQELTTSSSGDEEKGVDFLAAGLYLPGAQTVFATTLASVISVLANWIIPVGAISAIRTLALTACAGIVVIRRPIRIGHTKGVSMIFAALRPCCLLYVSCLVLEQLVHTCVSDESSYENGFARRVIYHICMTILTIAGFMRARGPRAEIDTPFLISALALLTVAMLPPPALALSGPLCAPPTLMDAAERVVRAFLFACVYVVLVYAAAPISSTLADTLVCIMRSGTACVWILGATLFLLPLAILQIAIVLYCSFHPSKSEYEGVALNADVEAGGEHAHLTHHHQHRQHRHSDATERRKKVGDPLLLPSLLTSSGAGGEATTAAATATAVAATASTPTSDHHEDIVATAAAYTRAHGLCVQPIHGSNLTFDLGGLHSAPSKNDMSEKARMEAIAATIA